MKNYKITVKDKKTKKIVEEFTELSKTLKFLKAKYYAKYRFSENTFSVKRLIRQPGVQLFIE
jgi:hypothetical protein